MCWLKHADRQAFDQSFAEQIANLLYQRTELRSDLCKALQNLVESNKGLPQLSGLDAQLLQARVTKEMAENNLRHLTTFAGNLLAVLFNVYTQTVPAYRAPILQCINAYLSVTSEKEIIETFERVVTMLESSMGEEANKKKSGGKTHHKKPDASENENIMPPMSHTLMDLITTISVYLPRSCLTQLFTVASTLLKHQDANLQKKAYKIIPRLGESEAGQAALQERSEELQDLLLSAAETASPAARKDRLAAIAQVLKTLPDTSLHFIPSVLPEVVISTKEQNEKARTSAYDVLVALGDRMKEGGMIQNSKVPHMPADSSAVEANVDEYITMVSAGLAGTSPHSISATVAATTRILHAFYDVLAEDTIKELVDTMDIFLRNPNREIVRSVLGFIKCCVLDLDERFMVPRLESVITNLLTYEHEHKGALQAKVKHIFERMIRKYGFAVVEKHTPPDGRKLINNIRKSKERAKRKRQDGQDSQHGGEDQDEEMGMAGSSKGREQFGDGFNQAVYGSDEDESVGSGSDISDDEALGRSKRGQGRGGRKSQNGGETFIVEDEDEPLDLLDRKALGRISSSRPMGKTKPMQKRKAQLDLDGKLVIGQGGVQQSNGDDKMQELDPGLDHGDGTLEGGIGAYVAAIRGSDVARRGKQGKLKFSNKRSSKEQDNGFDEEEVTERLKGLKVKGKREDKSRMGGPKSMAKSRVQRRGLGEEKRRPRRGRRLDESRRAEAEAAEGLAEAGGDD